MFVALSHQDLPECQRNIAFTQQILRCAMIRTQPWNYMKNTNIKSIGYLEKSTVFFHNFYNFWALFSNQKRRVGWYYPPRKLVKLVELL